MFEQYDLRTHRERVSWVWFAFERELSMRRCLIWVGLVVMGGPVVLANPRNAVTLLGGPSTGKLPRLPPTFCSPW